MRQDALEGEPMVIDNDVYDRLGETWCVLFGRPSDERLRVSWE